MFATFKMEDGSEIDVNPEKVNFIWTNPDRPKTTAIGFGSPKDPILEVQHTRSVVKRRLGAARKKAE